MQALRFARVHRCRPTIAERITDYRARNVADWVMYRHALARPPKRAAWPSIGSMQKQFTMRRAAFCAIDDFNTHFSRMRKTIGPPWNNDHKIAAAAAIVAANE